MKPRPESGGVGVLAVVGPTATGKTSLAIELAERLGGEIVNADALQVYRGLDIGTAQPRPDEVARAPHHLIDILDPDEPYSAGEFARRAREAIDEIHGRGLHALVVGGSGLYQRALFRGLVEMPDVPVRLRDEIAREWRERGAEAMHQELARLDPEAASRLAPADRQRITRALEVIRVSGETWTELQHRGARAAAREVVPCALRVGLTLPRSLLYDAILSRVRQMVEEGWIDEVRALLEARTSEKRHDSGLLRERGGEKDSVDLSTGELPVAFQAIGYRQIVRHLQGELSLDAAIDETVTATRRYAKRQLTWFRAESDIVWYDARKARDELPDMVPLFLSSVSIRGGS